MRMWKLRSLVSKAKAGLMSLVTERQVKIDHREWIAFWRVDDWKKVEEYLCVKVVKGYWEWSELPCV